MDEKNFELERDRFAKDLSLLGFSCVDDNIYIGKVVKKNCTSEYYIDVNIDFSNYPLKQPKIILKSINGNKNIYECIPSSWRHLDEYSGATPSKSVFYICCLHNWAMKEKFDAKYIYNRIQIWLECNLKKEWDSKEDLRSWRVIPQFSDLKLYLTKEFIKDLYNKSSDEYFYEGELIHNVYRFTNGNTAVSKNLGNKYNLEDISFLFNKDKNSNAPYFFFPHSNSDDSIDFIERVRLQLFNRLKGTEETVGNKKRLKSNEQISNCIIIKLNRFDSRNFKTIYQLFKRFKDKKLIERLKKERYNNIPLIIIYIGDREQLEVLGLLVDVDSFANKKISEINIRVFQIETLPERQIAIDLNISLLGAGSLGGKVAKLLIEKGVKQITLSDSDFFSASNLGHHELNAFNLGFLKAHELAHQLAINYNYRGNVKYEICDDIKAVENADIVVVTVGSTSSFDEIAFKKLNNYCKPIVWVWVSEHNILQEIVITNKYTGCLNCYYLMTISDNKLKNIHQKAKEEINKLSSYTLDICGDPHVISKWDRMVFLASQIITLLEYYSKNKKFPFEYINYFWKIDTIYPKAIKGYVNANKDCFCGRG